MLEIINFKTQEDLYDLVRRKVEHLEPNTFDAEDTRVKFTGEDNTMWNITHMLRTSKNITNSLYAVKSDLQKMEKLANEISSVLKEDGSTIVSNKAELLYKNYDRFTNSVFELNFNLAEYNYILKSHCGQDSLATTNMNVDKVLDNKKGKFVAIQKIITDIGADKVASDDIKYYLVAMYSARLRIVEVEAYETWIANEKSFRFNPTNADKKVERRTLA